MLPLGHLEPLATEVTTLSSPDSSKRAFIMKAAYVAPVVLTLSVLPAHRAHGSTRPGGRPGNGHGPGNGNGHGHGPGNGNGHGQGNGNGNRPGNGNGRR